MRPVIVVGWNFLHQCNHRLLPVLRWINGKPKAALILAPEYRLAKQGAEYAIKRQWKGVALTGPLEITARYFFPDRRKRDKSNYAKLLEDSMSGIVFEDDSQIQRTVEEIAGYDKTNPRVEISVTALENVA